MSRTQVAEIRKELLGLRQDKIKVEQVIGHLIGLAKLRGLRVSYAKRRRRK